MLDCRNILRRMAMAAVAVFMVMGTSYAQKKGDSKPYNLEKAYEVLREDGDEQKAISLLNEQLRSTPDNAECWMLLCRIYRNREEYGKAMSSVNEAIRVNKPKKSGIPDYSLCWWKASIYDDMGDDMRELEWLRAALAAARKEDRDVIQNISFDLGNALYELNDYTGSDAIFLQMLKDDETDQAAMAGLARNMIARGDNADAVAMLDACQKFGGDYASLYKFRSQAYEAMGETDKAIDDILTWFEKADDPYGQIAIDVMMKHRSYGEARAKTLMKSSDRKDQWRMLLLNLYEASGEYEKAIREYDSLEEDYGKDEYIYTHRAECYNELGLSDIALREIDKALELENDIYNICTKGEFLRDAGRYEEAIKVFDIAIDMEPSKAYPYYAKGWCYELMGDDDRAMEFYDLGIDLDKSYPYIFLMRGEMLLKRGDREKAEKDFEDVIQKDTVVSDGSCRQYALHFLGHDGEAEQWMQKIIDANPYDMGVYYDQACLYSRMGRCDEAVAAIRKALEMGYSSFAHIEHDDDLDAIRERDDFKALIAQYKAKLEKRLADIGIQREETPREEQITEVAISRHAGGTFDVDCSVNGLRLSMIFDTGASDVSISKVEADFMLKNNYLSKSDIKGKQYFQTADGGISEGTVITLKEVMIGDAVLHNVDASVVKNQRAPLLLGESVLKRFGTFTVDNINNKLIIKH